MPTGYPPIRRPPKLLDRVRLAVRQRHLSYRTENSYVAWVRRFVLFHDKRHPKDLGAPEVVAFLSHLAVVEGIGPTTQNQALAALVFLYRHVLDRRLEGLDAAVRAKTTLPRRLRKPLERHLEVVRDLHRRDLTRGYSGVPLRNALTRKYPGGQREWGWQWVFPASGSSPGEVDKFQAAVFIFSYSFGERYSSVECMRVGL